MDTRLPEDYEANMDAAEALDALFDALQTGAPVSAAEGVSEADVTLARQIIHLVKESAADAQFADSLASRLDKKAPSSRRILPFNHRIALAGAAAIILVIGALGVVVMGGESGANGDEERALALTSTVDNSSPTVPTAVAVVSSPTAPSLSPSATIIPASPTPTLTVTITPSVVGMTGTPTVIRPAGTPTPPGLPPATAQPPRSPTPHFTNTGPPTMIPSATAPAHIPTSVNSFQMTPMPTVIFDPQYQSSLQAGEINDNEEFQVYLQYRQGFLRYAGAHLVQDVDITHRHIIQVTTADGLPVLGAEVLIYETKRADLVVRLVTGARGTVYFFPRAYPRYQDEAAFNVIVKKGAVVNRFRLDRFETDMTWQVVLEVPPASPPVQLDVLFLVDSTGSMADEIDVLKANILSMAAKIAALPAQPDVRFALVAYRDRGDAYITQVSDFTADVGMFQTTLNQLRADGGGDYPESLNEALHRALYDVTWRGDNAAKLIILVADAPPQLYPNDFSYAYDMNIAASRGIKIHTIASSGLDNTGEYVFRQLAQFTGGNFIFLTYADTPQSPASDQPGAPGTSHNVLETQYTVEYLDALVVRLIEEELAALGSPFDMIPPTLTPTPTAFPVSVSPETPVPPAVLLAVNKERLVVNESLVLAATPINIGMPIYRLTIQDLSTGQEASISLQWTSPGIAEAEIATFNEASRLFHLEWSQAGAPGYFELRAVRAGTARIWVYAGGEVWNNGWMWSGATSADLYVTIDAISPQIDPSPLPSTPTPTATITPIYIST